MNLKTTQEEREYYRKYCKDHQDVPREVVEALLDDLESQQQLIINQHNMIDNLKNQLTQWINTRIDIPTERLVDVDDKLREILSRPLRPHKVTESPL